jgi:dipeptidyl aminopeptidase/acylaminoacyl peptidase
VLAYALMTVRGNGEGDLYTYDVVTGTNTQLTFDGDNRDPIWSPDGKRILYSKDSAGTGRHLHVKAADNSGADRLLFAMPGSQVPTGWPREDLILLTTMNAAGQSDIASWSPKDGGKPRPYLAAPWFEDELTVSPKGKFAAFTSRESGSDDVWLRDFPVPNGKWKVTPSGGAHPRWSRDGQFVYFWKAGQPLDTLFRARVDHTPAVEVRAPEAMAAIDASGIANWDLHPDGKRFVLSVPDVPAAAAPGAAGAPPSRFVVVLNWFTEARALVKKGNK